MKNASVRAVFSFIALALGSMPAGASAAEIKGLATIGLQSVMEDLAPRFEKASGHKVSITFGLGVAMVKRVQEGGVTARLLAAGETEMAVQQIGELISVPGVELLGPLPGDLQSVTTFAAAIPSGAHQPDAARALIKYLQSPEAMAVMKGKGLDPI